MNDPIVRCPLHIAPAHTRPHRPLEVLSVVPQMLSRVLVQRITRVGLEEQELQPHNHSVQIQHRLPVLAQDVQAHVTLEVDVRVIDLLLAFHFGWVVGEVLVDGEEEGEAAVLVHAFVWVDC